MELLSAFVFAFAALPQAILLSVAIKTIVAALKEPFAKKFPEVDLWWVFYVSFGLGAVCAWFGGIDLYSEIVSDLTLSRILTAATVGGGASLIHDIFDKPGPEPLEPVTLGTMQLGNE